ncbi:MAG: ABC transporter permease [Caryophanon sp.]|nr:ABC transporter permease [Caryophanon sp.]
MKLFKEKLAWAAPIAVILIIALFSLNLFAQGDPKVKNLPVALVVSDTGENVEMVKQAAEQLATGVDGAAPVIAFTNENEQDIEQAFADKKYYAALVIPEGYNEAVTNVLTTNEAATLELYINQGFNATGSNFAKTTLTALVNGINAQYSASFVTQLADQQIDAAQASTIVNPIVLEETIFNKITAATANGSAPTLMAVPAWVGALIGGFIVFLASSNVLKRSMLTRKEALHLMIEQVLFGVIIALFSGFTVATLGSLAGINMPGYLLVAGFVSFAAFCFFLLVSAITAWIGKPAITLFMIVMLLGMGVLMTPQEMLPSFFVDFVRPWVPIRFASEGLREIFYFGSGFYTGSTFNTILAIGVAGIVIMLASLFKPGKKTA